MLNQSSNEHNEYWGPRGLGDLETGEKGYLFSWSLGAQVIILEEVGSKIIILEI